jgi:hypothetical protein
MNACDCHSHFGKEQDQRRYEAKTLLIYSLNFGLG